MRTRLGCWVGLCLVLVGCGNGAPLPETEMETELASKVAALYAGRVSGDFTVIDGIPSRVEQVHSKLCVIELDTRFELDGDLEGAFEGTLHIKQFGRCDQPAKAWFFLDGSYEGTALGASGGFDLLFFGAVDPTKPPEETARGRLFVRRGSGVAELAGLRGSLKLVGTAGVEGSYRGRLWFAD